MITATRLSKRYGSHTALDDVSFCVRPGRVTGFLGPNGAGKSTTMRLILGLDRPTSGTVTVAGKPYAAHPAPLQEVGALLEAKAAHPGRTAQDHLLALAATHRIGRRRVREVIELTGLGPVARKRVGGFSLGMSQRLGIAAAMLGDPATLILDEPVNGLDPEGVFWVRQYVRHLAAEGRTVFVSSHLMSEMAKTADHLIVLGRGRILADAPIGELVTDRSQPRVRVRSPQAGALASLLAAPDVTVRHLDRESLEVAGVEASRIAGVAAAHGLVLHELAPQRVSLEDAYLALTAQATEFCTQAVG